MYVALVSQEQAIEIRVIVVMGVAAAGKTVVGRALADSLCWTLYDADEFHSAANIEKMRRGEPLDDADRGPWLETLCSLVADVMRRRTHAVLACSALKQAYRDALQPANAPPEAVRYVYLDVAPMCCSSVFVIVDISFRRSCSTASSMRSRSRRMRFGSTETNQ